ncbi:MAG: peptidylprolyl isomerase [Nanoarchaeota archaeon]
MPSKNMNRIAVFETNVGTFKVEMYEDKAPMTTKNFIDLVQRKYYDGTRFHRVIAKFMIQGGDPLSKDVSQKERWGTGGPGFRIDDEFGKELSNIKGTISMANSGPNTGGSQFFINVAANTFLDGKHAVFGKVIDNYELVEKISKVETDSGDKPIDDVIINKITIE